MPRRLSDYEIVRIALPALMALLPVDGVVDGILRLLVQIPRPMTGIVWPLFSTTSGMLWV